LPVVPMPLSFSPGHFQLEAHRCDFESGAFLQQRRNHAKLWIARVALVRHALALGPCQGATEDLQQAALELQSAPLDAGLHLPRRLSNRAQILSCVGFLIAVLEDKGSVMKLVIAIINPFRLQDVRDALTAIGVGGMTITEVNGYGRQKGHTEIYRGAEYVLRFLPKIRIEIAVSAEKADRVVEAVTEAAKTGQIGDGKIFVATIDKAVRIRTGETDGDAL
jgi:nitrogen regulatory protein P-II 2